MIVSQRWLAYAAMALLTAIVWMQPLPGGPRLPSFILMIAGLALVVNGQFDFHDRRWRQTLFILTLLWIPGVTSLIGSFAPEKTLHFAVLLPLFAFFAAACFYIIDRFATDKILPLLITVICGFFVFDAIVQLIFTVDLFGIPKSSDGRLIGLFSEHLRLGLCLSILTPIALKFLEKYGWGWQLIYAVLLTTVILFAGVRTDLITLILAFCLYLFSIKKLQWLLIILPMIILLGAFAITQSDKRVEQRLKTFAKPPTSYIEWNRFTSNRLDIWSTAWNMYKANPLNGVGARAFEQAYQQYSNEDNIFHSPERRVYHAHHPLISIIAETGTIGLLGVLLGVLMLFKWGKGKQSAGIKNPWLQSLILIVFPIQSMPVLFTLWWFPLVLLILILYLNSIKTDKTVASMTNG